MATGKLRINLFMADDALPEGGIKVLVKDPKDGSVLFELTADENGITPDIELETPDRENSMSPYGALPRATYVDVEIPAQKGMKRTIIRGVEIFDGITSILPVQLRPAIEGDTAEQNTEEIYIPQQHGVDMDRGRFSQPSGQMMPAEMPDNTAAPTASFADVTSTALANEVPIPAYITVHLGSPNATATNVRVPFIDYIKNVASSEIYPTWHEAALYANIYAQISFALNRIYTVWYRSRGFTFDITNSTAFDQYFVYGRNIFDNISRIVDRVFNQFLRRPGLREPYFAQYCNGTTATCPGMSQYGSEALAARGFTPIQILRSYYPNDLEIVESTNFINTDFGAYPGYALRAGSTGEPVRKMQTYLNRVSGNFYIPAPGRPDGVFGPSTTESTRRFQSTFNMVSDGIIGKSTWYYITRIYVAVKQLAELTSEGERLGIGKVPPTTTIRQGSRGERVVELQFLINYISEFFPTIPFVVEDGLFREATTNAVRAFQRENGLTADGVVGPATWRRLYDVYWSIKGSVPPPPAPPTPPSEYPGTPLRNGSRGESVRLMQSYLADISRVYPSVPTINADGIFGPLTQNAVRAFQWLFGLNSDGIIGPLTWNKIVSVHENLPNYTAQRFPGTLLRLGSVGDSVRLMQRYLSTISQSYPSVPPLTTDGTFGSMTDASVRAFQRLFGLGVDGIIGPNTWNLITSVYNKLTLNQ